MAVRHVYRTRDGQRVPGVTTVIGRFKESGGLIAWAHKLGLEGKDFREVRDAAADSGNMAHDLIEADIKGTVPAIRSAEAMELSPEEWESRRGLAETALKAYQTWKEGCRVELVESEVPMVSEILRVGGRLDAVAIIHGKLCILDWKASNRVYPDYIVQVAAYRELWNENFPDRPIEDAHLVRFDKQFANFAHHSFNKPVLDQGAKAFCLMRQLYDIDTFLKKAV